MPANLDDDLLRAIGEFVRVRVRSIERNEGIAFRPTAHNPLNPLDVDYFSGEQLIVGTTQAAGYDSTCGLNILPFVSDYSRVPLDQGTAAGGAASSLTLRAGASAVDDAYNGEWLTLTAGTGCGQIRFITDYVGATKVATVDQDWTVTPDNTTEYVVGDTDIVMG